MKHDFDKKIKDLMESINLSDTGLELDKDAVWNKIQSKQKANVIPFRKWISHAAAVIVGILLCLPLLLKKDKQVDHTITIIKTVATPVKIIRDTVFIQQPIANPVKANNTIVKQEIRYVYEKPVDKASQPNPGSSQNVKIPELHQPQSNIAFTEPLAHKNKVLHLLDMDNENAVTRNKKSDTYKLFNKIKLPSNPNDKSESISMIAGIQLSN